MVKYAKVTTITFEGKSNTVGFVEICQEYGISEDFLVELLEHGLIADISAPHKNLVFEPSHVQRILSACRLHRDLDINTHGAILALELMDELSDLRQELSILRRHLSNPD